MKHCKFGHICLEWHNYTYRGMLYQYHLSGLTMKHNYYFKTQHTVNHIVFSLFCIKKHIRVTENTFAMYAKVYSCRGTIHADKASRAGSLLACEYAVSYDALEMYLTLTGSILPVCNLSFIWGYFTVQ